MCSPSGGASGLGLAAGYHSATNRANRSTSAHALPPGPGLDLKHPSSRHGNHCAMSVTMSLVSPLADHGSCNLTHDGGAHTGVNGGGDVLAPSVEKLLRVAGVAPGTEGGSRRSMEAGATSAATVASKLPATKQAGASSAGPTSRAHKLASSAGLSLGGAFAGAVGGEELLLAQAVSEVAALKTSRHKYVFRA